MWQIFVGKRCPVQMFAAQPERIWPKLEKTWKDRKTCILVQIFLYASFRWQGPHQDWNLQPFGFSARTLVWHATRTWHWPRPRHACKQQQIKTVAKESKLPTSTNCVLGRRWGLPIALDIPCFLEPQTRSIYLSQNQTDIGDGSRQKHWSPEYADVDDAVKYANLWLQLQKVWKYEIRQRSA